MARLQTRPGRRRADGPHASARHRRQRNGRHRRRRRTRGRSAQRPCARGPRRPRNARRHAGRRRDRRRADRRPQRRAPALVRRVAAAGLPILCEKPCGTTAAQAAEAARATAAAGVPLQIAYWRRFVPALRRLRQRIAEGAFGGIYLAACYQWDERAPPASFRADSGGIFVDMGVHEFDQLRWLTGQDIVAVHASCRNDRTRPAPCRATPRARRCCATCRAAAPAWSRSAAGSRRATSAGRTSSARATPRNAASSGRPTPTRFLDALRLQAEAFRRVVPTERNGCAPARRMPLPR